MPFGVCFFVGVAAKLATQRRRRYSTLVRTEWKLQHFDKLRIAKRQRAKRLRGYHSELQSLKITPATDFMRTMEETLVYWAWQRLQNRSPKLKKVKIYINPSTVPGEGEVKLLEWILRHPLRGQSLAILGGDSDLLLEGLVIPPEWTHNIFVIRQEGPNDYLCVSLWETTRTLWNQWLPQSSSSSPISNANQILQIRTDLVLLMILNGNDYLPKLRGSRGFSNICSTYRQLLREFEKKSSGNSVFGLVHPDTLEFQLDFCIRFFEEISKVLSKEMWAQQQQLADAASAANANRRTPLGELNNIMDGGFVPKPLRFRVIKGAVKDVDDDDEDDEEFEGDEDGENVDMEHDDNEAEDPNNDQVLVQLTLGEPGTNDFLQYECWIDKNESFKLSKQKLAAMALDDFLGTEFSEGADDFDSEMGITNSGYSWEILHAVEGKVDRYLGGLLWNLQTYQDGICADYNYNYGRRMSPTAMDILEFFKEAKKQNRTIGRKELLGDTFGSPVSAGLSCLAALPSQVKHLIPEPYQWLPDDTVEAFYEHCMDPTDNCFDLKKFERLCENEIAVIRMQRRKSEQSEDVGKEQDHPHGRRIITGDHYWTVIGRTTEPLTHPFDPPRPPAERLSELWPNDRIRVGRVFTLDTPRPRKAWGDKPEKGRKNSKGHKLGNEIIHSDLGNFLKGKESLLDVDYRVGYRKERDAITSRRKNKKKSKAKSQLLKEEAVQLPTDVDATVDIPARMEQFNVSNPPLDPLVTVDGQTAMACLSQLSDLKLIGAVKLTMTSPSKSDYASHSPQNYEQMKLLVQRSRLQRGVAQKKLTYEQDRDIHHQSRQALKQHLASLALNDLVGPDYRWNDLTIVDLRNILSKNTLAPKRQEPKVDVKARMKAFNKVFPPRGPIVNLDGQTAMACLKQLGDAGMIGEIMFTTTAPSKSEYASYNPTNYEHHHLVVTKGPDETTSLLRQDLVYAQDRDLNKQTKQALRQHLASLALCDITGPQCCWSEMTFADLRQFLQEKMEAASF